MGHQRTDVLVIYGGLLAVTSVVVFAICRRLSASSDDSGLVEVRRPDLGLYDVAMLRGGDSLVLAVAACRLKEMGAVTLGEGGTVTAAGRLPSAPDPVESWAYVRVQNGSQTGRVLLDDAAAEPVLAPIRQRLWALGLLLTPQQGRLIRMQLLWFVPVFGLGVARLIAGANNHRPIGLLVVLLGAGVIAAWVITKPPIATRAGRRLLAELGEGSSALGAYGFGADVALSGVAALWAADAALATALGLTARERRGRRRRGLRVRRRRGVRRMSVSAPALGVGIGWREELAGFIAQVDDLRFVEVVAEAVEPRSLPRPLAALRARGVQVIPHGLRLSLGGAERPERRRLEHLAGLASALESPLVSEHVAFVRAGGAEAGHLMPVPRTREALAVLIENVEIAQAALPVPLALEHIATFVEWPEAEMDEAQFSFRAPSRHRRASCCLTSPTSTPTRTTTGMTRSSSSIASRWSGSRTCTSAAASSATGSITTRTLILSFRVFSPCWRSCARVPHRPAFCSSVTTTSHRPGVLASELEAIRAAVGAGGDRLRTGRVG